MKKSIYSCEKIHTPSVKALDTIYPQKCILLISEPFTAVKKIHITGMKLTNPIYKSPGFSIQSRSHM